MIAGKRESSTRRACAAALAALWLAGAGSAQAQSLTFHEATETDRGFDLETGDKVKLSSKNHVNLCLEREPDLKLIGNQRLYLVVDGGTENLCSQFYVFATKDLVENLGACSYAFPLAPDAASVETGKKKGASLTRVIVDNRAILNPDPEAAVAVQPSFHGALDWVVARKEKKGGPGKMKGPAYGELTLGSGAGASSALIDDGSIKASDPKDVLVPPLDLDCSCGDGLWEEEDQVCDATAVVTGCAPGEICDATCSACVSLCGNAFWDENAGEICDRSAPESGCEPDERCTLSCTECELLSPP